MFIPIWLVITGCVFLYIISGLLIASNFRDVMELGLDLSFFLIGLAVMGVILCLQKILPRLPDSISFFLFVGPCIIIVVIFTLVWPLLFLVGSIAFLFEQLKN